MNKFVHYPMTAAMAEPAAADLAVDVAAHGDVVLAARETQDTVRALATLFAMKGGASEKLCIQVELETKIAHLQEEYAGAANAAGPGGHTPLLLVCLQGSVEDVEALLALGADPAIEGEVSSISVPLSKYKCTPLMLAARDGRTEVMEVLLALEQVDANQGSSDVGRTALWFTGLTGQVAAAKLLLAHEGVDANKARTDRGSTPLLIASHKNHTELVTLLLAHEGIEVNKARTSDGAAALFVACQRGHAGVVKLLLAHAGINANMVKTDRGATPLYVACQQGHLAAVVLLLAHPGIDANRARTNDGGTPLYIVCQEGHYAILKLLLELDGIDVNMTRTDTGVTALYMACQQGHVMIVKLLLAHAWIDASYATLIGATPLHMACGRGHSAIVNLLLAHPGVDPNKATLDRWLTPLHGAIFGKSLLSLQYLVVYGANLDKGDHTGTPPAAFAATVQNEPALAEWLYAVSGWPQLRVAAACRLYKEAAFLLRRGKIDPDDPATPSIDDNMAAVAASTAKPAALPWQNAPPVCKATTKLVADATRGWHRTTHWLHHKAVRDAVFAVVAVAGRLQTKGALPAEASPDARADAGAAEASAQQLPLLPIELWFFAMRFFLRSWWEVEITDPTELEEQLAAKRTLALDVPPMTQQDLLARALSARSVVKK